MIQVPLFRLLFLPFSEGIAEERGWAKAPTDPSVPACNTHQKALGNRALGDGARWTSEEL